LVITTDTNTNKITLSASFTNNSGFTDGGEVVNLTTSADRLALGTTTGTAKLNIDNNLGGDIIAASASGVSRLILTTAGQLQLPASGFLGGIKLQANSGIFSGTGAPSDSTSAPME
jgi:hypothetical protein